MTKLKFSIGNAKLSKDIGVFSLPCGWTCPFAVACKSMADRNTGKMIAGGKDVRCYALTAELLFSKTRRARWHNFDSLRKAKTVKGMADLICASLPNKNIIRIHQSGDFYSLSYFDAWAEVASRNPDKTFYAYTKAIPFILKRNTLPANFKLIASYGGKYDKLIKKNKLQSARIVWSKEEAAKLGLKVSHDDIDAYRGMESFAIMVHGQQSAGPKAKRWKQLMNTGAGYKADYGL